MSTDRTPDRIDARAKAAADALIASYGDLDTENALTAAKSSMAINGAPPSDRRRWIAIAAAAVLVVGGTVAVAATRSRSTQDPAPALSPTTTPAPTAATTVPSATTLPSDTTNPPTTSAVTTTTVVSPPATIAAVSYLIPPPVLTFQILGTVEVPAPEDGAFAVAIGELGVAVNRWAYDDSDATQIDVIGFDGQSRNIANVDGNAILAYGPGDIAYLTRQATTIGEFSVVAVPLSGGNAGTVVATQPANINLFLEYPPLSFGHGPYGVIHRRQYLAGTAVAPYVDSDGKPITLDTAPATFVFDDDLERGLGGVIQSSTGMSWTLAVEAAPDRADTYVGVSPPAPGPDGRGVYTTHIGPNANPDVDFGEPTMWVVAELNPDGTSTWWSLPDGWEILASDTWGTVLGRQSGTQLELALADFVTTSE